MLMSRMFLVLLIMIGVIIMLFLLYVMMLHLILMPCLHLALHMLMVESPRRHHVAFHAPRRASAGPTMLYQTCDASFVLICKNDKVVARNLGPKCKRDKTCIWVPKSVVTNLVGPNKSWVPKTQA
jgi:hypothetical protein